MVSVPERGVLDLSASTWSRVRSNAVLWALVDRNILSVSQLSGGRARLQGSCYVGRVMLDRVVLDLTEKIPGALVALLQSATSDSFRIEHLPSSASDLGALISLLVRQFLRVTRTYVSAGREFEYRALPSASAMVSGRLNTTRTLKLRARGLRHLLAFERSTIRKNTAKNRILSAALREIGKLARLVAIPADDLALARGLSMIFSDCHDAELLFGCREHIVKTTLRLASAAQSAKDRDLLYLASVVLSHESFEHGADGANTVPRAWFLNLENLFQIAVQRKFQERYAGQVGTAAQMGKNAPLYPEQANSYRANPDLVFLRNGVADAIGDVKYKTWSTTPAASDLYQLLAHASAVGTRCAFLIFPGHQYEERDLGPSASGCRTWLFSVDVRNLPAHLWNVLSRLELGDKV
jgi:5-methylcytosine-specific restriction endonuclease McrBC regulatory subunit McrC